MGKGLYVTIKNTLVEDLNISYPNIENVYTDGKEGSNFSPIEGKIGAQGGVLPSKAIKQYIEAFSASLTPPSFDMIIENIDKDKPKVATLTFELQGVPGFNNWKVKSCVVDDEYKDFVKIDCPVKEGWQDTVLIKIVDTGRMQRYLDAICYMSTRSGLILLLNKETGMTFVPRNIEQKRTKEVINEVYGMSVYDESKGKGLDAYNTFGLSRNCHDSQIDWYIGTDRYLIGIDSKKNFAMVDLPITGYYPEGKARPVPIKLAMNDDGSFIIRNTVSGGVLAYTSGKGYSWYWEEKVSEESMSWYILPVLLDIKSERVSKLNFDAKDIRTTADIIFNQMYRNNSKSTVEESINYTKTISLTEEVEMEHTINMGASVSVGVDFIVSSSFEFHADFTESQRFLQSRTVERQISFTKTISVGPEMAVKALGTISIDNSDKIPFTLDVLLKARTELNGWAKQKTQKELDKEVPYLTNGQLASYLKALNKKLEIVDYADDGLVIRLYGTFTGQLSATSTLNVEEIPLEP